MKEVEKYSLGGYAFTFDKEAARIVGDYLGELQKHYSTFESGNEILDGIEERMGELLREKCGRDDVVTSARIEEIIGILGRPEDIEAEDEDSPVKSANDGTRKADDGKAGDGKAKGDTLRDIQRNIELGADKIDKAVNKVGNSDAWTRIGGFIERFIGVILLILAFAGLFTGTLFTIGSGILGKHHGTHRLFQGFGQLYDNGISGLYSVAPALAGTLTFPAVRILLLLAIFLPMLLLLYGALQMLFGFKSPKWHPGLVIFILWLLVLVASGVLIVAGLFTQGFVTI